jgi:hypothetical protein
VVDAAKECNLSAGDEKFADAAKAFMQRERDCKKLTPWIPGLTPKEHIDMLATREMLDAQAARLDAQAAREREWRKEDMKIASDSLKAARGNTTAQWLILAVALFAGVGSLGLSIWTAIHPQPVVVISTSDNKVQHRPTAAGP